MTDVQTTEICNLMEKTITKELGLRCGHRSQGPRIYKRPGYQTPGVHDFFVDLPPGANGKIRARLFAGYHTSTVSVFGTDFKEMRERIRARECETSNLAIDRFEVPNTSPQGVQAVWCRFKHRGGKNWSGDPEQEVQTLKDFLKWLTAIVACPEHKQPRNKDAVAMLPSNMENKWKGWDEYRTYWDNFVKEWFDAKNADALALPDDELTNQIKRLFAPDLHVEEDKKQLSRDELPEPYYGTPWGSERIDAVTIHLNPGGCQDGEESKCFSHLQDGTGWLLQRFIEKHECVYSRYQAEESPLSENNIERKPGICGVPWWLTKQNELGWIQQALGDNSIRGKRLFATELCPYHSQQCGLPSNRRIAHHLLNRVFLPATVAAVGARHKMVVCRGAPIASALERYGLAPVEWSEKAGTPNFPDAVARYRLYQVDGTCKAFSCLNSQLSSEWRVYFLVYSKQDYSFAHPNSSYKTVEDRIRQSIDYKFDALS